MLAIIALILIAIVALAILGFAAHILFSPWLLLVVVGILLWIKFGPRRSRQQPGFTHRYARASASPDVGPPEWCRTVASRTS
jgi:hypothetical protein